MPLNSQFNVYWNSSAISSLMDLPATYQTCYDCHVHFGFKVEQSLTFFYARLVAPKPSVQRAPQTNEILIKFTVKCTKAKTGCLHGEYLWAIITITPRVTQNLITASTNYQQQFKAH